MLKVVLVGLAVLAVAVLVLAVVVSLRPSELRVSRSAAMAVPPAAVFAQVNDFHRWEPWNPWGKLDPAMQSTYSGSQAGPGAIYAWQGNRNVGEGRMTILESRPNDRVRIQLEFLKPFAGTNLAEFLLTPQGDGTVVTWRMSGRNSFIAKAMGLVLDMDKMIGDQFEKGLADMKAIVETKGGRS